jgi:multidrug transporter EmrE-like cation transporter
MVPREKFAPSIEIPGIKPIETYTIRVSWSSVSTSSVSGSVSGSDPAQQRRSFLLVVCCTIIGAAAQILIKKGAGALGANPTFVQTAMAMLFTPALFTGYAMYGVSTVLLVLALRHGQLSLLYPVFAMTYVWVTILSVLVFHESMNPYKLAGIAVIVGGIAVLGRGPSA